MSYVLTESSKVACAHEGTVSTSGQSKLTVAGAKVLLVGGVSGKPVSGCKTPDDTNSGTKKCRTVASATGVSTKLKINGQGVALATLTGTTDGVVGGSPGLLAQPQPAQTKLLAQ